VLPTIKALGNQMKPLVHIYLILTLSLISACGTSSKGLLYREPNISWQDLRLKRIAIVPNRLPMNLQDMEKWQKYNWNVLRYEFERHDFEVIDYKTSRAAFEQSGLPVDDIRMSREKYARLAENLGVDAIFIPYYGTFGSGWNVLVINNHSYTSVATLQIYCTSINDFIGRIDMSCVDQYTTNLGLPAGALVGLAEPAFGAAILTCWSVWDIIQGLRTSNARWETAFQEGLSESLGPLFTALNAKTAIKEKKYFKPYIKRGISATGLQGGISMSAFSGSDAKKKNYDYNLGWAAGGFLTYRLAEHFSLQPELLFTVKGEKTEHSYEDYEQAKTPVELEVNLNYLDIILLSKYHIYYPNKMSQHIFVGPSVGFKLKSKIKMTSQDIADIEFVEDFEKTLKEVDYGLVFGGGFDFGIGHGKFNIDARYTFGITTVSKPWDLKNRSILLLFGYSL
jgi:hypothetical protein